MKNKPKTPVLDLLKNVRRTSEEVVKELKKKEEPPSPTPSTV